MGFIQSIPFLVVILSTPYDTVCINDVPFDLNGFPLNGVYSGTGMTGATFNPVIAGDGNFTITYSYIDTNGCSNIDSTMIVVDLCNGIIYNKSNHLISVYPNPANNNIIIENNSINNNVRVSIYNIQGNLLHKEILINKKTVININTFAKGMYFIKAESNACIKVTKFIKE